MPVQAKTPPLLPGLSPAGGKQVIARFDGGHLSSDGGLLVLCEVEQRLDLARRLAACIVGSDSFPLLFCVDLSRRSRQEHHHGSPV